MAKYHIYLKGMGENSVITVDAERAPDLATGAPWVVIGGSSFRLSEIVAVVAHDDLQRWMRGA